MRVLLDTHALLWWFTDDDRLSETAREIIANEENEIFVSAASAWEIATKQRIGKLHGVPEAAERFSELVDADGFLHLPITYLHSLRAGSYPNGHRDPFDRMLAAQSEIDKLTLVTKDPAFGRFGTRTLW
uniref:PIN domain nuclease, a component of toxin-antitoxin system (PIN domain) n=1 Tax=Candidatus Kentrum sp. FM TaxID=2126340 RepID=A0A450U2A6_9GAMM|nr:MAG: PIN domain nuclease, a component of toxin-antitoxin system (PIN domain) [Candidatus Kentron sp. FM]VFJ77067.1 MAG: PIN domain nuclease, a component of toxin-antitoxin system (PIN domain) [Candidatus Kentron sp. FM]VFK23869.1 MAG: PIN domain nuclease, a component of toxin-antitoxin system (PIN domain) [Candidatus Kentron sp. FM]